MRTLSVGLKIKNSPPALLRYGTMDFLNVIMLAGFGSRVCQRKRGLVLKSRTRPTFWDSSLVLMEQDKVKIQEDFREQFMPLPPLLQRQYLDRFDELIATGEDIQKNKKMIPCRQFRSFVTETVRKEPDKHIVDWSDFTKWRTNCLSLLSQVVPSRHPFPENCRKFWQNYE